MKNHDAHTDAVSHPALLKMRTERNKLRQAAFWLLGINLVLFTLRMCLEYYALYGGA